MGKIKVVFLQDGETANIGVHKRGDVKRIEAKQAEILLRRKVVKEVKSKKEDKKDGRE